MLSNRTASQIDHVPHTEAFADFVQLRAAGCKESAQQPAVFKPFFTVIHG